MHLCEIKRLPWVKTAAGRAVSAKANAVNIALAKKAKIVTGSEMPPFFAAKLKANGGNPADSILARFGGSVTVGGVRIATLTAMHSNGLGPDCIGGALGKAAAGAAQALQPQRFGP